MLWVYGLISWLIMGEIDALTGVFAIGAGFVLGVVAIVPPVPILSPISFVVVVGTMIFYPVVRQSLNNRELRAVDVDALRKAYDVLSQRPNNPSARYKLATHLWALGLTGHALTIADEALKGMPLQMFRDEHRIVAGWKLRPQPSTVYQEIECHRCGKTNALSEVYCQSCGAPYLAEFFKPHSTSHTTRRLIAGWAGLVVILMGLPASTVLPPLLSIVAVVLLLGAAGVVVWLAFRPSLGEA